MRITLENICFNYTETPLFTNLNLRIPLHRWVAITGECGSGKTSLIKIIAGLLQPNQGELQLPGTLKQNPLGIGYIFQNPDDQLIQLNLERELAFNLENMGLSYKEIDRRVQEALVHMGLWERRKDSPNELSGGQKQHLALMSILIAKPSLLILDEPTSFLDIVDRMSFYNRLEQKRDNRISMIWTTHEEEEIYLADYIIRLEDGRIVYQGETTSYLGLNEFDQC